MKLLVLDLEGTIFEDFQLPDTTISSTVWQGIAKALGPEAMAEEVATHEHWKGGGYNGSYIRWMEDTIAIHIRYGLTRQVFESIISAAEYNEGVVSVLSRLNRNHYQPMIVSGGFRELAHRAQHDLKIVHAFCACEYIFGEDQKIRSYNLFPCDFDGKIDIIKLMLRDYKLGDSDWIFVGDGANDVPIAKRAPLSIGYKPHADLEQVVTKSIDNFGDLLKILEH